MCFFAAHTDMVLLLAISLLDPVLQLVANLKSAASELFQQTYCQTPQHEVYINLKILSGLS